MRGDVKEAGDRMLAAIKGHVARAVGTLAERLDALDKRLNEMPAPTNGRDGIDGKDGSNGIDGKSIEGPRGEKGEAGTSGDRGADGETGPAGKDGLPGIQGEKGLDGLSGKDGRDGEPGRDADEDAITKRVLDGIPIPKDGKDGQSPDIEMIAAKAAALIPTPKDGAPGRDAAQLEILPAIDEARSYPRGTYATHDGGLWRSFETTIGVRGWENIVRGIADLEFAQDEHDFRKLTLTARLSGAMTKTFALRMDAPLFLGVFKDGVEYRRGDLVQQGGNVWHANRMTKERPIGSGDAWTMMSRKGNDGRDGKDGKDGDKGDPGPRGKDLTQMDGAGRKW